MNHPFITQIDHSGIATEQPEILFRFFTERLQLPVAFPFTSYPSYTTGSVALGNCFLEITKFGPPPTVAAPPFAARYHILGFLVPQGALPDALRVLEERHVAHSGIVPFFAPDATDANPTILWENVYLGGLLGTNLWQRLFHAMTHRSTPTPSSQQSALMQRVAAPLLQRAFPNGMPVLTAYRTNTEEHARAISPDTLRQSDGGLAGIQEVARIVVTVPDTEGWGRLLEPVPPSEQMVWALGRGPALQLQHGPGPAITTIILKVARVSDAQEQLAALGVEVEKGAHGLAFTVPQTRGLTIELTEHP